jgi:uridylate kinase
MEEVMKKRARAYIPLFISSVYEHDPSKNEKAEAKEKLIEAAKKEYRLRHDQIDIIASDIEVYDTTS